MATLIQFALDTLFAAVALFALGAIVQTVRTMAPRFAALREEMARGEPMRDLRVTLITTRTVVTSTPRQPAMRRPAPRPLPALRAAA